MPWRGCTPEAVMFSEEVWRSDAYLIHHVNNDKMGPFLPFLVSRMVTLPRTVSVLVVSSSSRSYVSRSLLPGSVTNASVLLLKHAPIPCREGVTTRWLAS